MSNTGIRVADGVIDAFTNLKKRNSENRYCIFKIEDDKVVLSKTVPKKDVETWEEFCKEFESDDCSYAVYVVPIKGTNDVADEKLLLFGVNGPEAKIKKKMLHAGTWGTLKAKLNCDTCVECDGPDDMWNIEEICKDKLKNSKFNGCKHLED